MQVRLERVGLLIQLVAHGNKRLHGTLIGQLSCNLKARNLSCFWKCAGYNEFLGLGDCTKAQKISVFQGGALSPAEVVVVFQNQKNAGFRIVLTVMLMAGIYGVVPARASAETSMAPVAEGNFSDSDHTLNTSSNGQDCYPGSGWMWTTGPFKPDTASQVQHELGQKGINAIV